MTRGGKERLIETAERLFAQRGIAGVSLREIGAAAGQRNTAAVLYHFGSKERLIEAIHERLLHTLDLLRETLPPAPPGRSRTADLRFVIESTVYPFTGALKPGAYSARFLAQRLADPTHGQSFALFEEWAVRQIAARLRPALPGLSPATLHRRVRLACRFLIYAVAAQERDLDTKRRPTVRTADLADDLVEMIVAMLSAPRPPRRHAARSR